MSNVRYSLTPGFYLCELLLSGRQRQLLRRARLFCSACTITSKGGQAAGGVRRPANRNEDSSKHASTAFLAKRSGRLCRARASSKSELARSVQPRWSPCRLQELYVREASAAAVYGPRRGYILSAGAFKQGLCEYLFKLPFSAARARQSLRPARQTLRPASRYTDGRHRPPPPVCNCVSGRREPNRALREQ